MSKKMTLIEMYQGCYKMWSRLAKTGSNRKPSIGILHNCYACEYHKQHGGYTYTCLGNCPMSECWGSTKPYGCEKKTSPWQKWNNLFSTVMDDKKQAKKIADFCANELKKRKKGLLPRRSKTK